MIIHCIYIYIADTYIYVCVYIYVYIYINTYICHRSIPRQMPSPPHRELLERASWNSLETVGSNPMALMIRGNNGMCISIYGVWDI